MKAAHKVELTICLDSLAKQKRFLYDLMDEKQTAWTDEMRENMEGLLNMLDFIEDQIIDREA